MNLATLLLLPLALLGHGVCTWALGWLQLVAARGDAPSSWSVLVALVVGGSVSMGRRLEWRSLRPFR